MPYSFNLQRDALIKRSFQLLNIYDYAQTIPTNDNSYAADILNSMIKMWQAEGIKMWKRKQAVLFPALNTYSYTVGGTGAGNCSNTYVSTTVSATASSGASTITVGTVTGMSNSDNIGIELDDGTRQWTTIQNISGTTITLNATLTAQASANNTVVTYTSLINRPLRILRATILDLKTTNSTESTMKMLSYDEYFNLPTKTVAGRPNNFYYDKQLTNGVLYLFPNPNSVSKIMVFTYHDEILDVTNSSDNFDFPQEWLYPLIVNLACELAYAYGKYQELQQLQPKAEQLKMIVKDFDNDEAALNISFNMLEDPGLGS